MPHLIEKVTAFVTRPTSDGYELLLFEHPAAGIQIPAGTVEAHETPDVAVLREASEETGLSALIISDYLGTLGEPPPSGYRLISEQTTVYARPEKSSFDWAYLRRGLVVKLEREADGYSQVTYEEFDRIPNPRYVTYQITGWIPNGALAATRKRHFYQLACNEPTDDRWSVEEDYHRFILFWAPLTALPNIISPQDSWLAMLQGNGRFPMQGCLDVC